MNETSEKATEFVRYVLQQLCENTEQISIETKEDHLGTLISVRVSESDMGKVIGKNGQTVSAIRLLIRGMGAKNNQKINLKVIDSEDTIES